MHIPQREFLNSCVRVRKMVNVRMCSKHNHNNAARFLTILPPHVREMKIEGKRAVKARNVQLGNWSTIGKNTRERSISQIALGKSGIENGSKRLKREGAARNNILEWDHLCQIRPVFRTGAFIVAFIVVLTRNFANEFVSYLPK